MDLSILDEIRRTSTRSAAAAAAGMSAVEVIPLYCCANGKALLAALPPGAAKSALPSRLAP